MPHCPIPHLFCLPHRSMKCRRPSGRGRISYSTCSTEKCRRPIITRAAKRMRELSSKTVFRKRVPSTTTATVFSKPSKFSEEISKMRCTFLLKSVFAFRKTYSALRKTKASISKRSESTETETLPQILSKNTQPTVRKPFRGIPTATVYGTCATSVWRKRPEKRRLKRLRFISFPKDVSSSLQAKTVCR